MLGKPSAIFCRDGNLEDLELEKVFLHCGLFLLFILFPGHKRIICFDRLKKKEGKKGIDLLLVETWQFPLTEAQTGFAA